MHPQVHVHSEAHGVSWGIMLGSPLFALTAILILIAAYFTLRTISRKGNLNFGVVASLLVLAGLAGLFFIRSFRSGAIVNGNPNPGVLYVESQPFALPQPVVQPPHPQPSIDEAWAHMTAPRINLEIPPVPAAAIAGPKSPQEVAEAAKVILSTALPGADPFTQDWLINAAKSILRMPSRSVQTVQSVEALEAAASAQAIGDAIDAPKQHDVNERESLTATAASPQPEWVVNPPKLVGNVQRTVLSSGPYATVEECRRELDMAMHQFVVQRACELSQVSLAYIPGLDSNYIRRELCTDELVETLDTSVGEMKQVYVLLEFNDSQDAFLVDRARTAARQAGLVATSAVAALVLGTLGLLYGLLKIDTWTRGYYTKRLFLGASAAIIGIVTLIAISD